MDFSTITSAQALGSLSGFIIAVGGAWLTVRKIIKDYRKEREHEAAKVIQEAKEADALLKAKLETEISKIKSELRNLEANVNKDMNHLRETYNSEIRNLGLKIEDLRAELRNNTSQIVNLLTKMIDRD